MSINKKGYNTIVSQAKKNVVGFATAYSKFIERVSIDQNSKSTITNYSRSIAAIALHFNRVPHEISVDEINSYLYRMTIHEKQSISYFKQAVYGLRHWFRLYEMEEKAIQMPSIKKEEKLPVVLSKEECKELFKAPRWFKHRFLLAFAYAGGLRMNELPFSNPLIKSLHIHRLSALSVLRPGTFLMCRALTTIKLIGYWRKTCKTGFQ